MKKIIAVAAIAAGLVIGGTATAHATESPYVTVAWSYAGYPDITAPQPFIASVPGADIHAFDELAASPAWCGTAIQVDVYQRTDKHGVSWEILKETGSLLYAHDGGYLAYNAGVGTPYRVITPEENQCTTTPTTSPEPSTPTSGQPSSGSSPTPSGESTATPSAEPTTNPSSPTPTPSSTATPSPGPSSSPTTNPEPTTPASGTSSPTPSASTSPAPTSPSTGEIPAPVPTSTSTPSASPSPGASTPTSPSSTKPRPSADASSTPSPSSSPTATGIPSAPASATSSTPNARELAYTGFNPWLGILFGSVLVVGGYVALMMGRRRG